MTPQLSRLSARNLHIYNLELFRDFPLPSSFSILALFSSPGDEIFTKDMRARFFVSMLAAKSGLSTSMTFLRIYQLTRIMYRKNNKLKNCIHYLIVKIFIDFLIPLSFPSRPRDERLSADSPYKSRKTARIRRALHFPSSYLFQAPPSSLSRQCVRNRIGESGDPFRRACSSSHTRLHAHNRVQSQTHIRDRCG